MFENIQSATDEALAAEIARAPGDRLCTELFRRYSKKIYLWSFGYTHEVGEALDLSQEIFAAIFRKIRSYSGRSRFSTWAYEATRNHCLGELSKRRVRWRDRLLSFEDGAGAEALETEVFSRVDAIEDIERILDAAREYMSMDELEAFVLRYREGLTLNEIAKIVGCENVTGARTLIRSARSKFGRLVEEKASEMSRGEHLDLETLEKYLLGKLEERAAEAARRHIGKCALCDLELKRLQRFAGVDSDDDLARTAEWIYARRKLENAFSEKVAPSAAGNALARRIRFSRASNAARWIVPAAVMAAGVFMIAYFSKREESRVGEPARRVVRGALPIRYGIELGEPAGELHASPTVFKWKSERGDNHYTLEIFTPTLARIYRAENIAGSSWTAPDTLGTILKPNVIYLWSVKGFKGLERVAVSSNGWFRIARGSAAVQSTP
jgi:RNA polymerase sigma factor (sigma-70 family)